MSCFQGFHFGVYGGIHEGIDDGNIDIELSQFLLGGGEIR
jgi:hypothetical protein